jgi:hypothetical protein
MTKDHEWIISVTIKKKSSSVTEFESFSPVKFTFVSSEKPLKQIHWETDDESWNWLRVFL